MDTNESYGKKIRNWRISNNMTQEDLAKYLNVSKQAVCQWEKGKNRPHEDYRDLLEREFGLFWERGKTLNEALAETKKEYLDEIYKPKKISEIQTFAEMKEAVEFWVDTVSFDTPYQNTLRRWVTKTLYMVIGAYKGLEYLSDLDDAIKKDLDARFSINLLEQLDPNEDNDWLFVTYLLGNILDSSISYKMGDDYDEATLDHELHLFYIYYIDVLFKVYDYMFSEPDSDNLTYGLLEYAQISYNISLSRIFRYGLEPTELSLLYRTALQELLENIAFTFIAYTDKEEE